MIKRSLYSDLVSHLSSREISLITGPRQSGKTTLMLLLKEELDQKKEPTVLLNMDVEWDRPHLESQAALIRKLELEFGKRRGVVFIDEIQRKEDAGRFLKGLYDLKLPYKFVVSGSGSLELKEKIHESLVGRKRLFELTTLTFEEFINHKTNYRYEDNLLSFFEVERERTHHLLMEYLNFGGYPRVVLELEQLEKTKVIDEVFRSVIERDVAYLLKVEKTDAFRNLIKVLAGQIGHMVNYHELSATLGISFSTVKKYSWYAHRIFLLNTVTPFARNLRKEISQSPAAYFWDLGMRNYALGIFGSIASPAECGFLFQNFVYLLLTSGEPSKADHLHYWRTTDKAEVDFVMEKGREIIPVEVKFKPLKVIETPRSLISFCQKYQPAHAYVVNLGLKTDTLLSRTRVHFIPYWELLQNRL
ncbi:MAG: ATP-binding protein [Desulfobacterales bacterium]|nr:ATP-binding protein [Desulfobacterales bacterium]